MLISITLKQKCTFYLSIEELFFERFSVCNKIIRINGKEFLSLHFDAFTVWFFFSNGFLKSKKKCAFLFKNVSKSLGILYMDWMCFEGSLWVYTKAKKRKWIYSHLTLFLSILETWNYCFPCIFCHSILKVKLEIN